MTTDDEFDNEDEKFPNKMPLIEQFPKWEKFQLPRTPSFEKMIPS
jgi:hypothetical protein